MQARGRHLNQRRGAAVDGIGQAEDLADGHRGVFGESAVAIAADQTAVRANAGLAGAALQAGAAGNYGIDDDADSGTDVRAIAALDHFADHFVAHDQRILRGNRALIDFEIRAAQAGVRDAHQHLAFFNDGARNLVESQLARSSEDHGLHHSTHVFA